MTKPGRIDGPDARPDRPVLREALERIHTATRRTPTDDDRPPPSTFPMTPAARAALEMSKRKSSRR